MKTDIRTLLALLTVQVFFAIHYLAAKFVVETVPPRAWAFTRVAGAAIVLLLLNRIYRPGVRVAPRDMARLGLFALFGVVINQICFTEGIRLTVPSHSALINTLIPVSTFLFAIVLRAEGLSLRKGAGLLLAFSGVMVLLGAHHFSLEDRYVRGDLLTLANACSFGLFLVVSRDVVRRYPSLTVTAYMMAWGAVGIGVVGVRDFARFDFGSLTLPLVAVMAWIILFATVINYLLNYYALARVESSTVALFIYLQPLLATILSVGLGRETLTGRFLGSAALVFAGVFLVARAPKPTRRAKILEAE